MRILVEKKNKQTKKGKKRKTRGGGVQRPPSSPTLSWRWWLRRYWPHEVRLVADDGARVGFYRCPTLGEIRGILLEVGNGGGSKEVAHGAAQVLDGRAAGHFGPGGAGDNTWRQGASPPLPRENSL